MTNTAIANKRIQNEADIAEKKIASEKRGQDLDYKAKKYAAKMRFAGDTIKSIPGVGKIIANDPAFYDTLSGDSGTITDLPTYFNQGIDVSEAKEVQAGMVTFSVYMPIYGQQKYYVSDSDINVGFFRYLSWLRSKNSRVGQYEAGDIGQVTLASIDLFSLMLTIRRAITTCNVVDPKFNGLASRLLYAQGVDPVDALNNVKDYRAKYVILADRINEAVKVPSDMTLMKRRALLNSTILVDRRKGCKSFHVINQADFGYYDESNAEIQYGSDAPTWSTSHGYGTDRIDGLYHYSGLVTIAKLLEWAEHLFDPLQYSSVLTTMYADIEGAVAGKVYQLPSLSNTDLPDLTDHPSLGDQIRNACVFDLDFIPNGSDPVACLEQFSIRQDNKGKLYQGRAAGEQVCTINGNVYNASAGVIEPAMYIWDSADVASNLTNTAFMTMLEREDIILDVDDANVNAGGIAESIRFKNYLAPEYIYQSGTGTALQCYKIVPLTTEFMMMFGRVPTMASGLSGNERLANMYGVPSSTVLDAVRSEWTKMLPYGYHPVFRSTGSTNGVKLFTCDVHNLILVPEHNRANIAQLGTHSLLNISMANIK